MRIKSREIAHALKPILPTTKSPPFNSYPASDVSASLRMRFTAKCRHILTWVVGQVEKLQGGSSQCDDTEFPYPVFENDLHITSLSGLEKSIEHMSFNNENDEEDIVKDFQPTLEKSILNGLQELYLSQTLCDAILVVEDKRFFCHKVILSSVSPYFRSMYTSCLKESEHGEVVLLDISACVMQTVLTFIYTGAISLTLDNAKEMFTTSSRLHIVPLQDLCARFFIKKLNTENCICIYQMAYRHNHVNLIKAALEYICWHFIALSGKEDFLYLDLEELANVLSSDKLMVPSELYVYCLACRWWEFHNTKHKSLPEELIRVIRFRLILPYELGEVKSGICDISCLQDPSSFQLRQGMYEERIICFDFQDKEGEILEDSDYHMDIYDLNSGEWTQLPSVRSRSNAKYVAIGRHLYMTGGSQEDVNFHYFVSNKLNMYDSELNEWMELPSMAEPRCSHGFLAYNQKLYAVGGCNDTTVTNSAECFNVQQNCWSKISNLPKPVNSFASTQLKGKLYLIGGDTTTSNSDLYHRGFLVYNTFTDAWSQFARNIVVSSAGAVALDNKVFVIGGYTPKIYYGKYGQMIRATSKCFCLNDQGQVCLDCPVPQLPKHLATAGVVLWKRRIYVLGGGDFESENYSNHIYYWTPGDSKWTECRELMPIEFGVIDFGCAMMQFPLKPFQSLISARRALGK
ncbi:kelch-like protein 5 [Bombina bombina]|uniref:kelch-like protein 5 n=1 Tax=Bombina bombina TaxID=8345 RepID=UPI00235A493B|nr:kelch-like protein 5 [Bombina bombina]